MNPPLHHTQRVIVPITDDATWLRHFAALPEMQLPSGPVTIVAPHPDDETLGTGALISTLRARSVPVTVIAVTDGENAYSTPQSERARLGTERSEEQQKALAVLGVVPPHIHRLHLPDSGLAEVEDLLTKELAALLEPGTTLFAPWAGDFHPDHETCARAALAAARTHAAQVVSYFFWTWHRGSPPLLEGLPLYRCSADPEALAAKARALRMHRSQLHQEHTAPILPERLLGPARWPFEVFLPL